MTGLIVDSFAGGGGTSLGIYWALGRAPDIAINHDESALAMHAANHPHTKHYPDDIWRVNPLKATGGRPVGLFWCSPDCRHFSRAKGSKPVSPRVRGLAMTAVRWAELTKPSVIILENVREFQEWGPLIRKKDDRGRDVLDLHGNPVLVPDPTRKGQSFRRFVGRLRNLGYAVEWRDLDAADYGAPTHRKRLFLIARNDGKPIAWPAPTHAPRDMCAILGTQPYRTAADCIDWSLPCPSIFTRKRPLAENTLKRIAEGLRRYVIGAAEPFIVTCNHEGGFRGQGLDEPFKTVTGARDAHGVVTPYLVRCAHGEKGGRRGRGAHDTQEPIGTVTGSNDFAVVEATAVPFIVGAGGSEYAGKPRGVDRPAGAMTSDPHKAVVTAYLAGCGGRAGQSPPKSVEDPLNTATAKADQILVTPKLERVSAFVAKHFGGQVGVEADRPLPTTTQRGTQNQVVTANLIHLNHGEKQASDAREPLRTVTAGGLHHAAVKAFLVKYYGTATGQDLRTPLHSATSRARFGLVMVAGEPYAIVDIGMRMLTPRELARAQGFPDSYVLTGTKTSQVAKIGNSVCPVMAKVLVVANCVEAVASVVA